MIFFKARNQSPISSKNKAIFKFASVATLALAVVIPAHALDIEVTYDAAFQQDAAAMATVQSAVNFLDSEYTNNTVVKIAFQDVNYGLGTSSTFGLDVSYASYLSALTAASSGDATDKAALAQLVADPYTGSSIHVTTALARNLGLYNYSGTDSNIALNVGLTFSGHANPVAGEYDLYAIALHEMDEVLGTASSLPNDSSTPGTPGAADLFRYDASGNRVYNEDTSNHAYFSVDGKNLLREYNSFGRTDGDWGDWASIGAPEVQDAYGTPGVVINYGPNESTLLDAVGYNVQPAPEPITIGLMIGGVAAFIKRKRS